MDITLSEINNKFDTINSTLSDICTEIEQINNIDVDSSLIGISDSIKSLEKTLFQLR